MSPACGEGPGEPVLRTEDLTVRFGGITALDQVSLDCRPGELTGLIGPNGAGKTTFIDAVTGFLPNRCTGTVVLGGEDITGEAPHHLARRGLNRTWQSLELFDDLTVRSNIDVGTRPESLLDLLRPPSTGRQSERTDEILQRFGLDHLADRLPSELSQGQQKLVGVARAVAASSLITLLDEPAAGLDRNETRALGTQLRGLVDEGETLLLVDHDMELVMRVCDRIHVLVFGRLVATDKPDEIRNDPEIIAAYLGSGSRQ